MTIRWVLLATLLLAGCRQGEWTAMPLEFGYGYWLQETDRVLQLGPEQARLALEQMTPPKAEFEHFRHALLQQQLQERDGWIGARDELRMLLEARVDSQTAGLLRALLLHNQAMINTEQRHRGLEQQLEASRTRAEQLQQQLESSRTQTEQLQQKIEALTNLEKRLNIRKDGRNNEQPPVPAQ